MAFFELNSEIRIGKFTFKGVHDVRIRKGIYGYTETAFIQLPSKAFLLRGADTKEVTTGTLFTDGDEVVIKLGYNGVLKTEFEGFVKRRNLNMPLEVECEGYVRKLRLQTITANLTKGISVKKLLELACNGTGIQVECPVDFTVYGRNLVNATGIQVLDEVKKCSDGIIAIFFKEPKLLWCGLVYTPYLAGTKIFDLPTVSYRLGYNVVKDNGLTERIPNEPVQVIINGQLATGDSVLTQSDNEKYERKVQILLNGVRETAVLRQFANEKANQMNYTGYEGNINAFLEPYCLPGYNANVTDARYPERDAVYLVESTEVSFGVRGARRKVGIGVKLS